MYESATLFFGDICGFTSLTSMSTATQTIKFLNDLYNVFDKEIDNYDVYKVDDDYDDDVDDGSPASLP